MPGTEGSGAGPHRREGSSAPVRDDFLAASPGLRKRLRGFNKKSVTVATWEGHDDAFLCGMNPLVPQQTVIDFIKERVRLNPAARREKIEVGYGGAMGGGKSKILPRIILYFALKYPGGEWAIARNEQKYLHLSTWPHLIDCLRWLKENYRLQYQWKKGEFKVILFNGPDGSEGSVIWGISAQNYDYWKGANWDGVALDEATQISYSSIIEFHNRCRGSIKGMERHFPRVFAWASNPAPGYFKREYYDRLKRGELKKGGEFPNRIFVPAKIDDNPYLPPDYKSEQLRVSGNSPEKLAELNGEWAGVGGLVFEIPDELIFDEDPAKLVNGPLRLVRGHIGYDWGSRHHASVGIMGFVADGRPIGFGKSVLFVVSMFSSKDMPEEDQAEWMREFPNCRVWGDKSTTWQKPRHLNLTIAEHFKELGVNMEPANEGPKTDTRHGIHLVQGLIRRKQIAFSREGVAGLLSACDNWTYVEDPKRPGEYFDNKFVEIGEDECDALRYMVLNAYDELEINPFTALQRFKNLHNNYDQAVEDARAREKYAIENGIALRAGDMPVVKKGGRMKNLGGFG